MSRGLFISFEGGEGAGKTTLIKGIEKVLQEKGCKVVVTREPGGSELGDKIRSILLNSAVKITPQAELCLFLASRSQHLYEKILPALNSGKIVLCDRFNDSSVAYQGFGRNLGDVRVATICREICDWKCPDLTFFLDLDPQKGLDRINEKHDRIESEKADFHQKVRKGYLKISEEDPERVKVLDASLSKEKVLKKALKFVEDLLVSNPISL